MCTGGLKSHWLYYDRTIYENPSLYIGGQSYEHAQEAADYTRNDGCRMDLQIKCGIAQSVAYCRRIFWNMFIAAKWVTAGSIITFPARFEGFSCFLIPDVRTQRWTIRASQSTQVVLYRESVSSFEPSELLTALYRGLCEERKHTLGSRHAGCIT